MSDFIREVDEDYRRDRALEFWKAYGWMILLAAGLIILGVAGYTYYQKAQQQKLEAQATAFIRAEQLLASDRKEDARSALEAMQEMQLSPGYRALTQLRLAQMNQQDGASAAAIELYERVSADPAVPKSFRDLANVTATSLQLDRLTSEDVIARLSALTLGSDFKHSASELIGVSLLREGNKTDALPYFRQLRRAQDAPQTLRARATTLLNALDDEALPDVSGALEDAQDGAEADADADAAGDRP